MSGLNRRRDNLRIHFFPRQKSPKKLTPQPDIKQIRSGYQEAKLGGEQCERNKGDQRQPETPRQFYFPKFNAYRPFFNSVVERKPLRKVKKLRT